MKIGILFGGRSYEHDISVITAVEVFAALKGRAEVYPIYASEGAFYLVKKEPEIQAFANGRIKKKRALFVRKGIRAGGRRISLDAVVMCCHGGEGENGVFSALMESADIPYTSSGVLASAITMDKRFSKMLCASLKVAVPRAIWGRRGEDIPKKAEDLRYPLIVKPARLGSSIGIAVAHDEIELIHAVAIAFSFDSDIIVEEFVADAVELNCAAFAEGDEVVVGSVENPRSWSEFLTFEEKYEGGKYKGGGSRIVEGEIAERVKKETKRIYRGFELFGIVRADYLYSEKEDILYLNEINSQPGSLAYYLFEGIGISFPDLLMRVIEAGRERAERKDIISFNSGVLQNLSEFSRK